MRIVQCTQIGSNGRFGNQLFQYAFARSYAEKYNAVLEIPEWIGEKVFKNVSHPKLSCVLPQIQPDKIPWGEVNIDLFGYFQEKDTLAFVSETKIREWFQFQDRWLKRFKINKSIVIKHYNESVVAHLGRGDYVSQYLDYFCVITDGSYVEAMKKIGHFDHLINWLCEETQKYCLDLDEDLQFLPDFFEMINAEVLYRANSSFSFWAGFFNEGLVYSPVVGDLVGVNSDVEFVLGNYPRTTNRTADFIFGS